MIGVLRIARLEVLRGWKLLPVGFGLGLIAGIAPMLEEDGRFGDACTVCAAVVAWIISFATGMSLLGRPLHDGKLAFFFARPIHGFAISAGKVIGGLMLVIGMDLLLLFPLIVANSYDEFENGGPVFAVCMTVVFLAAGVVVGILARSRSRWFILDAIGGTTAALLAVATFAQVNQAQRYAELNEWTPEQAAPMFNRIDALMRTLAVTGVAVVLVAVIVALAIGRTDRDRVHRSLAITLWSSLAVVGVVGLAFAHWELV